MSCLEGKEHEFEYSIFDRCYRCKKCESKRELIEDPEKFEKIATDIIKYCQEMGRIYELSEAIIPIVKWIINLTYLWNKVKK